MQATDSFYSKFYEKPTSERCAIIGLVATAIAGLFLYKLQLAIPRDTGLHSLTALATIGLFLIFTCGLLVAVESRRGQQNFSKTFRWIAAWISVALAVIILLPVNAQG